MVWFFNFLFSTLFSYRLSSCSTPLSRPPVIHFFSLFCISRSWTGKVCHCRVLDTFLSFQCSFLSLLQYSSALTSLSFICFFQLTFFLASWKVDILFFSRLVLFTFYYFFLVSNSFRSLLFFLSSSFLFLNPQSLLSISPSPHLLLLLFHSIIHFTSAIFLYFSRTSS